MARGDLVSLTEAKQYLQSPEGDDRLVNQLIRQVSSAVRRYTSREFKKVTGREERLDGGDAHLIVAHRPILTVNKIEDMADADNPITVNDDLYTVYEEEGMIRRGLSGRWGNGLKRWRVTYDSGFEEVPEDVKLACLGWISSLYSQRTPGLQSERLGDYSYTKSESSWTAGVPAEVATILSPYVEVTF